MDKQRQEELEKQIAKTRQLIGEYEKLLKTTPDYEVIEKARIKLELGTLMSELMEAQAELTGQTLHKAPRETRRQQLEKLLNMADNLANQLKEQLAKFGGKEQNHLNRELEGFEKAANNWKAELAALPAIETSPDQRSDQVEELIEKAYNLEQTLLVTFSPMSKARIQLELSEIVEQIKELETGSTKAEFASVRTHPIAKLYNELQKLNSHIFLNDSPLERIRLEIEGEKLRAQIKMLEAEITGQNSSTEFPAKSFKEELEQAYQLMGEIRRKLVFTVSPLDRLKLEHDLEQIKIQIEQLEAELEQDKAE